VLADIWGIWAIGAHVVRLVRRGIHDGFDIVGVMFWVLLTVVLGFVLEALLAGVLGLLQQRLPKSVSLALGRRGRKSSGLRASEPYRIAASGRGPRPRIVEEQTVFRLEPPVSDGGFGIATMFAPLMLSFIGFAVALHDVTPARDIFAALTVAAGAAGAWAIAADVKRRTNARRCPIVDVDRDPAVTGAYLTIRVELRGPRSIDESTVRIEAKRGSSYGDDVELDACAAIPEDSRTLAAGETWERWFSVKLPTRSELEEKLHSRPSETPWYVVVRLVDNGTEERFEYALPSPEVPTDPPPYPGYPGPRIGGRIEIGPRVSQPFADGEVRGDEEGDAFGDDGAAARPTTGRRP
jgi:hypothetical protein